MFRFLKFFLTPDGGQGGNPADGQTQTAPPASSQTQQTPATGQQSAIDYAKIQQMLEGTLAAKEDTALKAYFKQQGLSQQEAEQAMAAFKAEKAKNQPDVNALQAQAAQAQEAARQAQIEAAATMTAVSLGIEAKTIPYVLKMADLSQVMGTDGKINDETLKAAVNKVLEDVPALKPQTGSTAGFTQVGVTGNTGGGATNQDALKQAFGI